MDDARPTSRGWRAAGGVLLWLAPGLLQCVQEITYVRAQPQAAMSDAHIVLHYLPTWLPWAAFTPWVLLLTARLSASKLALPAKLGVHAVAAVAFGLLHLGVVAWARASFPPAPWAAQMDVGAWMTRLLFTLHAQAEVLAYVGVVGFGLAREQREAARLRELRAVKLEAQLSEARLRALQGQLRPHFLFNTLNAIDVLMREDAERAGRMLTALGELLRRSLAQTAPTQTLREELEHLDCYLEIERTRFEERLAVETDVEPAALDAEVPSLVLQPLVENAILHGLAPLARGGRVRLAATVGDGALTVAVEDDGVGVEPGAPDGIGLANARERLRELYGDEASLELGPRDGGGTRVELRLPVQVATSAEAASEPDPRGALPRPATP